MSWDRWAPLFEAAIDRRLCSIEHLRERVAAGQAQTWFGEEAAIVTEIRIYPSGARVIHGLVATGDLHEIVGRLIPLAEAWGRATGCSMAMIESREGWARPLRAHGYVTHQVTLRKAL